jgi:hypothetical protein
MVGEVQSGDVEALRANTIPAVAADFSGIAGSVDSLKPLVQQAAITVDSLYALDASTDPVGAARTDFYCGTPVVVLNFTICRQGRMRWPFFTPPAYHNRNRFHSSCLRRLIITGCLAASSAGP